MMPFVYPYHRNTRMHQQRVQKNKNRSTRQPSRLSQGNKLRKHIAVDYLAPAPSKQPHRSLMVVLFVIVIGRKPGGIQKHQGFFPFTGARGAPYARARSASIPSLSVPVGYPKETIVFSRAASAAAIPSSENSCSSSPSGTIVTL